MDAPGSNVRARVQWEHARLGKKIILFDTMGANGNGYGVCAWDECDEDALSLFWVRQCEHIKGQYLNGWDGERVIRVAPREACAAVNAGLVTGRHAWWNFCSESHRLLWLGCSGDNAKEMAARHQGRIRGYLPEGQRLGRFR
jgi:hypothetical protein